MPGSPRGAASLFDCRAHGAGTIRPLAGTQGVLVRRKDKFRVVLSLNLIMRSVAVEVDEADIEPC